ncbi:MAG: choice-of-anchor D domain-containing protein [Spirochaetia bacterium]|nr:choice-of-anchor D domain-containing protein [Spirochaetia bacterium]
MKKAVIATASLLLVVLALGLSSCDQLYLATSEVQNNSYVLAAYYNDAKISGSVDLGANDIADAAVVKTITLKNAGLVELSFDSLTLSGTNAADFALGAPGAKTLAVGATTTFTVSFDPTTVGDKIASVDVVNGDEIALSIALSASATDRTAVAPPVTVGGTYDTNWDNFLMYDIAGDALAGPDISAVAITNDATYLYIAVMLADGANKGWNNAAFVLVDGTGGTTGATKFDGNPPFPWGNKNFTTTRKVNFGFFSYGNESGFAAFDFTDDTTAGTDTAANVSAYFDTVDGEERFLEFKVALSAIGNPVAGQYVRVAALMNDWDGSANDHVADVAPNPSTGPVAGTACVVDNFFLYRLK